MLRKSILAGTFFVLAQAAHAEPVVIAALGDSLTQGYGLVEPDGFVPQMRDWLAEQGAEVQLINAGVSGDTTAGGAARVGWTLTPEVDAMIVALGGNDLLRGIAPEVARANLARILDAAETADVEVLLVGMQAPGNYGPDYKVEFDAIYPELAAEFDTLYAEDFFAGLEAGDDPAAAREMMQADGIHPNAEGVERIVAALGPHVLELAERAAGE
ncbi:acyl-CoA thioesterase-1 [Cribrihabitans marinus]|uniref:Acyl-CoA thioesterase-1 n=1 Tax=Cribrihabitans marinus TaxID=1227549 RepID=A0A1H7CT00_9RHOB|nr:arylesterase [Cribrihabitans marinus]GGH35868.1 arylesterase [Cribrihabitans marinus]SEJ90302.1 acyl-CoA thioesterase-1 [Cribrihabitans marinus]